MKTEAKQIAQRVPLPEKAGYITAVDCSEGKIVSLDGYTAAQLRAYGLAVAAEALRGAEAPVNANVRRLAKVVVDTHLAMDRSGVIGRDGALHCEHCGAMRDSSDGGTDETHRPNCVVLIAESILSAPPAGSVEVTDAMVERLRKIIRERWSLYLGPECARAALTAALQEPSDV